MSKKNSFEEDIKEASKILEQLKSEDITLDESLKLYKKGQEKLLKATKLLEEAKLEFEEINKENS